MADKQDRRYFRIIDEVGLSYQVLTQQALGLLQADNVYGQVPALDILSDMDNKIEMLLNRIKIKTPDVAILCRVFHDKIKYIVAHSSLGEQVQKIGQHEITEVDMSACGLAVTLHEKIERNTYIDLSLVLKPTNQYLRLLAKVIACEKAKSANGDYLLRVDFENISENIQEVLIQHIVKRQGAQLQASREKKLQEDSA